MKKNLNKFRSFNHLYFFTPASQVRVLLEQAEEKTVLWATQGRDTDKWVKATVDILRVATPFRVKIIGIHFPSTLNNFNKNVD